MREGGRGGGGFEVGGGMSKFLVGGGTPPILPIGKMLAMPVLMSLFSL